MSTKTLTVNTSNLYQNSQKSLSLSPLPPIPSDFPLSKLIPKTRFIVDGFRNAGEFSITYFLSHFHSDHYAGLSPNWSQGLIFCSDTTARLATDVLGVPLEMVISLPMNETVVIDGCEVTLIDANHCPGAVQFLFRIPVGGGKFERFVHTGDFRYCESMKLEHALSQFVGCDSVFLDTTYCDPKFVFPLQEESIDYVVNVVKRFGADNGIEEKNVLFLVATYVIGKERILVEVSRRCGRKIYVDSRKREVLRVLGYEDEDIFTDKESATDVHVVGWNVLGETWPYFRPNFMKMKEIMVERGYSKVVGFIPTGWTYEVKKNKFAIRTKDMFEIHLVPYSEHSNYNELREYVKFLKPKQVIPTVGSDIENMDSKHAVKMRKHFAGLMDEMANKHEFLMGFFCAEVKAKLDDPMIKLDRGRKSGEEKSNMSDVNFGGVVESDPISCPSNSLHECGSQDLASLSGNETDKIMEELRDCLPVWVSKDQILELVKISSENVVDAVSYFYEHETEFHEQSAKTLSLSQLNSKMDCSSLLKPTSVKSSPPKVLQLPNQSLKTPPLKHSLGNNVSPGKRKRHTGNNNQNKKSKPSSNLEPSGIKQSTITKFFSKNSNVCQESAPGSVSGKRVADKISTGAPSVKPYQEELEQFIQIISDSSESTRNYTAKLLEKARGNIELALDMYYSNSELQLDDGKNIVVSSIKSVSAEGAKTYCKESSPDLANEVYQVGQESSSANVTAGCISLPLDKYSPIEHACWNHGQPAPYIHLARTFGLVEGEKGKIKATSMICNMFRSLLALSPEDVLPAVYLCTNKIAADHENMELNIGGSLVASAIEEACGTKRSKIREMYNALGDLGDVAQECRQTQSLLVPPSPLLIRDVYAALRKVSIQTGTGSMGRRKGLILGLMRCCREKEMKFLVRTLVRNLRIGAMMRTVLPALAQAVALNSLSSCAEGALKIPNELLQGISVAVVEAYNVLPDLDLLVPSLMSKGIEFSSTTLTMVPGIPIRPMLAKITNGVAQALKLFQNKAFTCEYKYDGQRAQIHKLDDGSVRIFSRNGDETTSRFPDLVHIIQDLCKTSAVSFIIDAEVVGIDHKNGGKFLSFQELSTRERGSKASLVTLDKIKVDICVLAFDVMFVNGEKLLAYPLRKRRQCMKDLFRHEKAGYFEYAKQISIEADDAQPDCEVTLTKINYFLEEAFQSSCEGIMVKSLDLDAGYCASKRAESWLKVKRDYLDGVGDSLDLVPIGAWYGNGRKAGWYSPFLVACYNLDTEEFESVCRVMSGFSDSFYMEMKDFFSGEKILSKKPLYYRTDEAPDMWFPPELVWEIRGADLTVSPAHKAAVGLVHPSRGISMRFPRFVRSLSDRRPEDCSTSADIAEMFNSQTRKMDLSAH